MSSESSSFWTYKWTVFIIYPLLAACVGLILYDTFVFNPEQEHKAKAQQTLLDSMSCQQLGKFLIDNSKNYTSSYTYIEQNYHYAESKYLVCTHGGISP